MQHQIVSASRREDMPAFRMQEIVRRFHLPKYANAHWVLWTKNPALLPGAGIDLERVSLQLTITGLAGTRFEPAVPSVDRVLASLESCLKAGLNPRLVNWRFDPIIPGISSLEAAETIAARLAPMGITRCTCSFFAWYGEICERWPEGGNYLVSHQQEAEIAAELRDRLLPYDIALYGCAQKHLSGIVIPSHCIDGELLSRITGLDFDGDKDTSQRPDCGCSISKDIGERRACPHGCLYCYSTGMPNNIDSPVQLNLFDEL